MTTKAKSVRRCLDKDSHPKLTKERRKNQVSRLNQSKPPAKKTTVTPSTDEEEAENQRIQQQQMKAEFLKPVRDGNKHHIGELFRETFALRRKDIIPTPPPKPGFSGMATLTLCDPNRNSTFVHQRTVRSSNNWDAQEVEMLFAASECITYEDNVLHIATSREILVQCIDL